MSRTSWNLAYAEDVTFGELSSRCQPATTHDARVDRQPHRCPLFPRRQANASERALLGSLCHPCTANGHEAPGLAGAAAGSGEDASRRKRNAPLSFAPPAPVLLSRSHSSIELLPLLFSPLPHPQQGLGNAGDSSYDGGIVGVVASATNATSTTTEAGIGGKPTTRKKRRVAKVNRVAHLAFFAAVSRVDVCVPCLLRSTSP